MLAPKRGLIAPKCFSGPASLSNGYVRRDGRLRLAYLRYSEAGDRTLRSPFGSPGQTIHLAGAFFYAAKKTRVVQELPQCAWARHRPSALASFPIKMPSWRPSWRSSSFGEAPLPATLKVRFGSFDAKFGPS